MNYIAIHTIWRGITGAHDAKSAAASKAGVSMSKVLETLPEGGRVIDIQHIDVGSGALPTYGWTFYIRHEGDPCTT